MTTSFGSEAIRAITEVNFVNGLENSLYSHLHYFIFYRGYSQSPYFSFSLWYVCPPHCLWVIVQGFHPVYQILQVLFQFDPVFLYRYSIYATSLILL